MSVPSLRIRAVNDRPIEHRRSFVVYWMIGTRRAQWNFALDRALEHAHQLKKPLWVVEAFRAGYPWASDRLHAFVLQGMKENARAFDALDIAYCHYVEPEPGAGRGMLQSIAKDAAVVITDEVPGFFLPQMVNEAAKKIDVRLEAVDGNGLVPLLSTERIFPTAYVFRRFLQKTWPQHVHEMPDAFPKSESLPHGEVPASFLKKFPYSLPPLSSLAIDHSVPAVQTAGGAGAAVDTLDTFLQSRLPHYAELRSDPDSNMQSGLSPYLHFGHLSVHEVFSRLVTQQKWTPAQASNKCDGRKDGYWGMDKNAEAFLDEILTWRELGFHQAAKQPGFDQYESLPPWAKSSLERHEKDVRSFLYTHDQFENAHTHDALWNAAQCQLLTEGTIHNYLRMLWGKKILEWSSSPKTALRTMVELNNKYALDGRDPNSYSGIFWCLGRFDRPWPPERPVYGVVRSMSSANTARKWSVKNYLRRYEQQGNGRRQQSLL